MIDIEGLATGPETTILTIAARSLIRLIVIGLGVTIMCEWTWKARKGEPSNKAPSIGGPHNRWQCVMKPSVNRTGCLWAWLCKDCIAWYGMPGGYGHKVLPMT